MNDYLLNQFFIHQELLSPPQDKHGKQRDAWENVPIRVTDIATAPNGSRFIAVGISREPVNGKPPYPTPETQRFEKRVMIWNWEEKCLEE